MYDIEGLLLNALILAFFILFLPLFLNRILKTYIPKQKKWIFISSTAIAIMICISFPIDFSDGFIYDLRFVAQIIGSLYGGFPASVLLWLVTVIYRGFFGGLGIYSTLIVSTIILFLTLLLNKRFREASKKNRLIIGIWFSMITSFLGIFVTTLIFNLSLLTMPDLIFFVIQLCSILIIIYILEMIRENTIINRRLIKTEKMEIVSYLASSISHEVRNPLAVVRGFLQLMEQAELPVEKRNEFLKISLSEIDRANEIIRNYLTFAKPASENIDTLNIKDELERSIEIIKPLANMYSVEIYTDIDHCFIRGESQLFQQCLLNITKNCIEAMPNSGRLLIGTKEMNGDMVVEIIDTGLGMTEEQVSRLGEPYFTTKGKEGTGLGMMAAIKIIEMMQGKLRVKSKINEGTKFQIIFPLVQNKQIAATIEKELEKER